jgi:hypothetical protein
MIQIVPALPPAANGVGDYGLALAHAMRNGFGVETRFVVGSETWEGPEQVDGFGAQKLRARSAGSLAETLDAAQAGAGEPSVLLQLSGYGYSPRGCPFWLLRGLRRWKQRHPGAYLVTMFHELYATAPPWRKTFWVSPAQKMVVAGLARVSDVAATNIERHRRRLERFDPSKEKQVQTLAVPSNVGEPASPGELRARAKSMVIFGLPGSRQRAYETRASELLQACERLGIEEVHDVGERFGAIPERIGSAPVIRHGRMNGCELSALLLQSMAGFVNHLPGDLGKSGVFAAYCAHRMLPVTPQDLRSEADGIARGIHYYSAREESRSATAEPQAIADAAWNWYRGHSLQRHARAFAGKARR